MSKDEHPRETTLEQLAKLPTPFRANGSVTAGNASGVNDGSCALIIASEAAAQRFGLTPKARIVTAASAGVEPRIMGIGPIPAVRKVLARAGLDDREDGYHRAQRGVRVRRGSPCCAGWASPDDAANVNLNGGAIALGHPLGMSGARLATTAT